MDEEFKYVAKYMALYLGSLLGFCLAMLLLIGTISLVIGLVVGGNDAKAGTVKAMNAEYHCVNLCNAAHDSHHKQNLCIQHVCRFLGNGCKD